MLLKNLLILRKSFQIFLEADLIVLFLFYFFLKLRNTNFHKHIKALLILTITSPYMGIFRDHL